MGKKHWLTDRARARKARKTIAAFIATLAIVVVLALTFVALQNEDLSYRIVSGLAGAVAIISLIYVTIAYVKEEL